MWNAEDVKKNGKIRLEQYWCNKDEIADAYVEFRADFIENLCEFQSM